MRTQWKAVADNLIVRMSRAQMQEAYDYYVTQMSYHDGRMPEAEYEAAAQTIKFLAVCMAECDAELGR